MKIDKILGITSDNAGQILGAIILKGTKVIKYGKKNLTIDQVLAQYDPNLHDIHNPLKRKDKVIKVPAPDSKEDDPDPATVSEIVKVNRVSTAAQRLIVRRHVAFLTGSPVTFIATPRTDDEKTFLEAVRRVYDNVKMKYLNNQIGTLMSSETHCAELWYIVDEGDSTDDFEGIQINTRGLTLRCRILAYSLGDSLYPIWDNMGDMVGFLRVYEDSDDDDNPIQVNELYTATKTFIITRPIKGGSSYTVEERENPIGKIPVIYYAQPAPEWFDVQPAIERFEKLVSNTGDSNDYYASPTTVVSGNVIGFNRKGETGKILETEKDATVSLLEARNGVESVKFEKELLKSEILEGSQTPDISFESMKSLGTFSGIALKMLFFDASLKVESKMPTYGMSKQRSINFVKATLALFDNNFKAASRMPIEPKIEAYMPQDTQELIDMLNIATGQQPIMSQDTAINLNPLVDRPSEEINKVAADNKRLAQDQNIGTGGF